MRLIDADALQYSDARDMLPTGQYITREEINKARTCGAVEEDNVALKKELDYWYNLAQSYEGTILKLSIAYKEDRQMRLIDAVDEQPTVDAEPIRHGRWIIKDNPDTEWYQITCSECREDVTSTAPCIGFFPNAKVLWDYCPYCGAKMDAVTQKSVDKALKALETEEQT